MQNSELENQENSRYIVFEVSNQILAMPLMSAREVLECEEVKTLSRSEDYFKGITNIRGDVAGVVDLREMFGLDKYCERPVMILFELESSLLVTVVDRLVRVDMVEEEEIQPANVVKKFIDKKYVSGVYQKDDQIITVVDLKAFLEEVKVAA